MIIWSTLNEHNQHAKKDLSDGPGLIDSASHLPNQRGRQSECFGPVSLLLWWGWGVSEGQYNRQMQKRERTGKSMVVFRLLEKLKYSNERSTKFESLNQEKKYLVEENGKMVALQLTPKIGSLYGLGRQAKKL